MRKRKINLSLPHIRLPQLPIKLIIFIIVFLVVYLILGYGVKILKNLDYFKIKDIAVSEGEPEDFSYLKNHNIFNIDLRKESRYISELYPVYKNIRLIRILPNRLYVDFIRRRPSAYIKLYRYFCVDDNLTLFDLPGSLPGQDLSSAAAQVGDLPVILGLDTKIYGPRSGQKYNIRELALALGIIRELNSNNALRDYQVKTVDVANLSNISFFLLVPLQLLNYTKGEVVAGHGMLEVKIGPDDIKYKIGILNRLFIQIKDNLDNVKYIDLRFKEPVIKFNEDKS